MAQPIAYITNPIVRHSGERGPDALAQALADPRTAVVILAGDQPVLRIGEPGTCLLPASSLDRLKEHREQVLLGSLHARSVVAVLAPEAAEAFAGDEAFTVTDLRSIAVQGLVPPEELGILATAKSVLGWHAHHRFCSHCGAATEPTLAGYRRDCPACGTQHFPRTDPVVIMLITKGENCLLGRGAHFPERMYSCLAGFLEPGETVEDAVRRETFEETGIHVGAVRYIASQPWPFPSSIMIGCAGEAETDAISLDPSEIQDALWVSKARLKAILKGEDPNIAPPSPVAIANHLLRGWAES